MAESTDPKVAYLAGILDGFRLSRAVTLSEADDLIAEIRKGDVEARIRAAHGEFGRRQETDSAETDEHDPGARLNLRAEFARICARTGADETDESDQPLRLN